MSSINVWKSIPGFDRYSVSNYGQVRNDDTGRIMAIARNQQGVCYVGLIRDSEQKKRGLALLVASAFVPKPIRTSELVVPIHLDGDQSNNKATNLLWRPQWFAAKYAAQFKIGPTGNYPIVDLKTKEVYPTPWHAAIMFGLLEKEIIISALNRTFVWPTFQEFRFEE